MAGKEVKNEISFKEDEEEVDIDELFADLASKDDV